MKISFLRHIVYVVCMAFLFLSHALASGLEISPVRLYLSKSHKIASFTMTNLTREAMLLQGNIKHWSQINGEDNYTDNHELLITPPIVSIPPGKQQVFRIALSDYKESHKEETYRIFLHQVISKVNKKPGLQFALQISLPIFIQPSVELAHSKLIWSVHKTADEIVVTAKNPNNQHVQVSHLRLGDEQLKNSIINKNVFNYLLAGQSHTWVFKNNEATNKLLKTIKLSKVKANTDIGEFSSNLLTA